MGSCFFSIVCGVGIVIPLDKSLAKEKILNIVNRAKIEVVFCSEKYKKVMQDIKKESEFLEYIIAFDTEEKDSFNGLINEGKNSLKMVIGVLLMLK